MPDPVRPDGYRERLSTPWWGHPVIIVMMITLGLESSFLAGGLRAQVLVVVGFVILGELMIWRYGSRVIEVGGGTVRAGRWRLPIAQIRAVAVLDPAATRRELRRRNDELYRCTRSWIQTSVLLQVDDADDLPYWLVSTRHPYLLAAALADAASAAHVTT